MTDTDLAWAAGIVDGEGTIGIVKDDRAALNRKHGWNLSTQYKLRLSIGMTCKMTIDHIRQIFDVGKVNGQKCYKKPGWKQVYYWAVNANQAWAIIELMMPYLVTKLKQAQIAEQFIARSKTSGGIYKKVPPEMMVEREELFLEMRKLNARGE